MNSICKGVQKMHGHAKQSKSAWKHILNLSPKGADGCVYPLKSSSIENKIGLRLNKGEPVNRKPGVLRLKLQVKKRVEDTTLKKYAQKNSHKIWATVDVDTTQETSEGHL